MKARDCRICAGLSSRLAVSGPGQLHLNEPQHLEQVWRIPRGLLAFAFAPSLQVFSRFSIMSARRLTREKISVELPTRTRQSSSPEASISIPEWSVPQVVRTEGSHPHRI